MKKLLLPLFILCLVAFCHGQEILRPRPQAKFVTSFPFKMYSGGVMVITARFAHVKDSFNFILDTGSGGISLDSATASAYQIVPRLSDTSVTGFGSSRKVSFVYNQPLHLPGLTVDNLNFHINNYEILTSVYGEKINGIVGYSFLSRYIVKIDFDSLKINVFQPGDYEYPKVGQILRPAFTSLPIQNIHLKDRRPLDFNFYLDTGAGLNFLMSENFAEDSMVLNRKRKPIVTYAEGIGGKLKMGLTVVKLVQVGRYKFRNVPSYIFEDQYNVTSYPFVGGLIGNDLLRRFNLTLNYPQREIHLSPNSHYNELFDYGYTGMAMYYNDGRIVIEEINEGSPAAKAGIKEGDVLVGVGLNFTNNIMQYKTLLQAPGEKIKLVLQRNGKLIETFIRPISIL
jgi:hypothetical protein